MNPQEKTKEIREGLSALIGQRLIRSNNYCATRNFYFGQGDVHEDAPIYTLGIECPWRVRTGDVIIVGSEDYFQKAEDNKDESWEAGTPTGHLQNQKLAELLGELQPGGSITNTGQGLRVESVEADAFGGFRIGFGETCALEVFPASAGQMEWILIPPGGGSLILMHGVVTRLAKKDVSIQR
jgi:hypothetical protein